MKAAFPWQVILVATVLAISLTGDSLLYVVLPSNLAYFGVPLGLVGIILGVNRFVRLFSNAWAGWIYERFSPRTPFLLAVVLAALTTAAYGLGRGFWALFLAHLVWGICWSFLRLGAFLTALEVARGGELGRTMGILLAISRSGPLLSSLLGGLLADVLGIRETFLLFALITALGVFIALKIPWPWKAGYRMRDLSTEGPASPALGGEKTSSLSQETRPPRLRLMSINWAGFSLLLTVNGLVVATLGLLLKRALGPSTIMWGITIGVATVTGFFLASKWLSDLGLAPLWGHISDRVGRRRMIPVILLVLTMAILVLGFAPNFLLIVPLAPAIFIASTALTVTLDASAGELAPASKRPQIMSRYHTWLDLGSATGPIMAYAVGATIGFQWGYTIAALFLLVASAFYIKVFYSRASSTGTPEAD